MNDNRWYGPDGKWLGPAGLSDRAEWIRAQESKSSNEWNEWVDQKISRAIEEALQGFTPQGRDRDIEDIQDALDTLHEEVDELRKAVAELKKG